MSHCYSTVAEEEDNKYAMSLYCLPRNEQMWCGTETHIQSVEHKQPLLVQCTNISLCLCLTASLPLSDHRPSGHRTQDPHGHVFLSLGSTPTGYGPMECPLFLPRGLRGMGHTEGAPAPNFGRGR